MKAIFLDINGVLNSADLLPDEPTLGWEGWKANIVPAYVAILNVLVEQSGASVVLSSTWRHTFDPLELTLLLKECGATFAVDARTPPHIKPRVEAIRAWLSQRADVEAWVALDDSEACAELGERWVRVEEGLCDADVEAALERLGPHAPRT